MPDLSPQARDQKISELSTHFANDALTLEELERRIEQVYKARSTVELEAITADLAPIVRADPNAAPGRLTRSARKAANVAPVGSIPDSARILSIMGETRRMGRWQVPQQLDVMSIMSDTKIDLTQAVMPAGIVEFDLRVVWASCKLIVPPGMRVINEMHAIMASVHSRADEIDATPREGQAHLPTIRLTGMALMSEVKVVVRRREDPIDDDDE